MVYHKTSFNIYCYVNDAILSKCRIEPEIKWKIIKNAKACREEGIYWILYMEEKLKIIIFSKIFPRLENY